MRRLRRVAWIATLLSPLFLASDVLLSSQLENGLALTTKGYCISVRVDCVTGRMVEVPGLLHVAFVVILLAAVVPPPVLWMVVLLQWWGLRKSPLKCLSGPNVS